jgi:hypothetical protein
LGPQRLDSRAVPWCSLPGVPVRRPGRSQIEKEERGIISSRPEFIIAPPNLTVSVNKKAGTVSVSFESLSPQSSADIVKFFLEEGKSRLQE